MADAKDLSIIFVALLAAVKHLQVNKIIESSHCLFLKHFYKQKN